MALVMRGLPLILMAGLVLACAPAAAPPGKPAAAPAASASAAAPGAPAAPAAAGAPPAAPAQSGGAPLAASAPVAALAPLNPPQKVRIDAIGIAAEAPFYLALEQGYFRELGLDIEITRLQGSTDTVALLSSEQLDVGGMAINPGAFNAIARNVGIRMVADRGSNLPGRATPSLAVRTDILERKPWSGYGDLRGLKLAYQEPNSIIEHWVERLLERGGLGRADVELVTPLTFPNTAVAFANKAIDAAIFNEPWATTQEQQGIVRKVAYMDEIDPGSHVAAVVFSETFARKTPVARNYLVGWLRGVRDYWDAYDGRRDFQIVVEVLQKHTALKDEALIRKIPPTGQNPHGYLDPATLARQQDWFAERGLVPQKADIARVYDPSFAEYANAVLGPYEPAANPRRPE